MPADLAAALDSYEDEEGDDTNPMEGDESNMEERKAAAGSVMSAFKSGDVDALEAALHSFYMACGE